jgi:hypothetical protein
MKNLLLCLIAIFLIGCVPPLAPATKIELNKIAFAEL